MNRLILVDGNSIMNRAFYGIMGSKMLTAKDGRYTNAVYGFLSIIFKIMEDLQPKYMGVAFDLKGPTQRHLMYDKYKANRKGMPNELAEQMPMIKEILKAMNISIIEKAGYEGDDIIGTLARKGEREGLDVTILSGDRDNLQIATDKITIRIPRTKMGKTETDDYTKEKIIEEYGIEPIQLIEVKGLMGDTSDNIPGVPGVGEKTAINLIKEYGTIEKLYDALVNGNAAVKGKLKENLESNKELALISKSLGTINIDVPIEDNMESLKVSEWDKQAVLSIFKELNFNRYIERFNLNNESTCVPTEMTIDCLYKIMDIKTIEELKNIANIIKEDKKLIFYLGKEDDKLSNKIIKKSINSISIFNEKKSEVYYIKLNSNYNNNFKESLSDTFNDIFNKTFFELFKEIFENTNIEKFGYKLSEDYVILKQMGIKPNNFKFDAEIAGYDLDPTSKYTLNDLSMKYLSIDFSELLQLNENIEKNNQINLFEVMEVKEEIDNKRNENSLIAYCIGKLYTVTIEKLKEIGSLDLFYNIEMPLVEVLGEMQFEGVFVDKNELIKIGDSLKQQLEILVKEIIILADEEFNINSTQQLGVILFEKLKLPSGRKNKKGYSTDVDTLEKIKHMHPIIEKILEYRSLTKLNSTYVEGLLPYINTETKRIHSYFHQTITATGRISSTEPNLQNIPTRLELGKTLRKVFKPAEGYIYIDADYSQIELRVLAHISKDENMVQAFKNDEDIHKQAASKVLNIPMEEVTKEQRSSAKAVNFGIVYGISDFGLSEQLGISKKQAKEYIEQYLEKYSGIKMFMEEVVEQAKKDGFVETLFHRRRYIPELNSNNFMVRQFGARAAMNTPIQGTAADIMKIAMINVYKCLRDSDLDAKIILQVHDELILECNKKDKEQVSKILKQCMESAINLDVPIKADTSEAENWYETK
ncbi:MAG TPA: DNA polymerase I [Clostridia bacterium]|nr:DNA polymerase I [Clostridia bacterium]